MAGSKSPDGDSLFRILVEDTAGETGIDFFRALVTALAEALEVHGAWVTEYLPEKRRLRAIAFRLGDQWLNDFEYDTEGTPCGDAIQKRSLLFVQDGIRELYPADNELKAAAATSYMGVPLFDARGESVLGHMGILHTKALPASKEYERTFRIFANRAGAELRRLKLEQELRARTEELDAVLQTALDAMLILNQEHEIVRANPAAEALLGTADLRGHLVDRFLSGQGAEKLEPMLEELARAAPRDQAHLWIPGGVEVRSIAGDKFAVEGTLSRYMREGRKFFTLILRNIEERLAAEARLASLQDQTAYLREEIARHFGEIIGESPPMRKLMQEIREVAGTEAAVLIFGETGTGKELVARALHSASRRSDKPLIKVNCAAIPAALMESEFFGHEKGAFTGATCRREGRFALADGGTMFLDEIGELPMELQVKLLRVLQEGEFEPVGSARMCKVDVRVIAATNRDLRREVEAGRCREDLYYRLSVFPIHVPALRNRGHDVDLLAQTFVRQMAQRDGRKAPPLSERDLQRLRGYHWPGNVRELANVIERALITGTAAALNLDRSLPAAETLNAHPVGSLAPLTHETILTARELEELEIANIKRALEAAGGRVSGPRGAAGILGLKPTTLSSRIKALGLRDGGL